MRSIFIPRISRAAMAFLVAAVAAWACDVEEVGIGPRKGEELGFRCTIEGKAGVCIHSCGSDLMCVTDGRREDADTSCVDGAGDAGRGCPAIGDPLDRVERAERGREWLGGPAEHGAGDVDQLQLAGDGVDELAAAREILVGEVGEVPAFKLVDRDANQSTGLARLCTDLCEPLLQLLAVACQIASLCLFAYASLEGAQEGPGG